MARTESNKSLVHTDATRLFQEHNDSEEAWSTRYTSPSYTVPRSTSKMAHIKARLNRQRDGTAFASVVMPAQYAVVVAVLAGVKTRLGAEWAKGVDRVVEWGSGTGAGMWCVCVPWRSAFGLKAVQGGSARFSPAFGCRGRPGRRHVFGRVQNRCLCWN